MTPERFCALLDAYGADLQRWPEAERSAAHLLAAQDVPELRRLLIDAASLDSVLDKHQVALPDDALMRRIVSTATAPSSTSTSKSWWQVGQWWPRAGFALTGLAGALAGAFIMSAALRDTVPPNIADWQRVSTAFSDRAADWSDE